MRGPENQELKALALAEVQVGVRCSIGYDLVLVGNFDEVGRVPEEIAFYHHRDTLGKLSGKRRGLVRETCRVLREVADVFGYPAYNVALFYQEGSVSRFIRQQILINVWPIAKHLSAHKLKLKDMPRDPFAHLYIYGLLVHKLAHFFDLVHGTRHDFHMNEIRIEYLLPWLDLLESKGWDPAELESKEYQAGSNKTKLLREVVL